MVQKSLAWKGNWGTWGDGVKHNAGFYCRRRCIFFFDESNLDFEQIVDLSPLLTLMGGKLIGAHCWLWWEEGRRTSRASRCHLPHPEVASSCLLFSSQFFCIILANCCDQNLTAYHTQKRPVQLPYLAYFFQFMQWTSCHLFLHSKGCLRKRFRK